MRLEKSDAFREDFALRALWYVRQAGEEVGYCPDFFPWGGVCRGATEEEAYRVLCALVLEEVEELVQSGEELPLASTRVMRVAVSA